MAVLTRSTLTIYLAILVVVLLPPVILLSVLKGLEFWSFDGIIVAIICLWHTC